ncbi:hypothetical protein CL630_03790 [bacterium]|nr:hypothetical protein [bacterium]|tara:strand:+ start:4763 stop:5902 length:1140 start_codon:yes stop_codon:yes gene_type:complete
MDSHIHPVARQIAAAKFFTFAGFEACQQFLAPILNQTGKSQEAFLSILVLYAAFAVSGFVVPYLLRSMSYKTALIIAAPAYLLFIIAAATANTLLLFTASILVGIAAAFLWSVPVVYISSVTQENERARNLGLPQATAFAGGAVGIAITALLLASETSSLTIFTLLAILACVGVLLYVLLRQDPPRQREEIVNPFRALVHPMVAIAFFMVTSGFMILGLLFTEFAVHLSDAFGIKWVGWVLLACWVAVAAASYAFGWISDIIGRIRALVLAVLIFVLGSALMLFETRYALFVAGLVFSAGFGGAMYPVWNVIFKEMLPKKFFLPAVGLFVVANSLGVVIAATLSLFLDIQTIVIMVACISVCDLALLIPITKRAKQVLV